MGNGTAATVPAPAKVKQELVMEFSPEELQAPFLLRLGSMIIDYLVLVVLPAVALLYARIFGEPLGIMTDRTLWFISVLLFLANIIVLPILSGKSIGKMLTGLRIMRIDGSEPSMSRLIARQTIGYLVTALTLGLGFLFCIFSQSGRTLHDRLTDTMVVWGRRRIQ